MNSTIRIEANNITAAVILFDGKVRMTAPVFRYMIGWSKAKVLEYCEEKHWLAHEYRTH